MDKIKIAKLTLYGDAKLPTRKHKADAGMDLYAYIEEYDEGYGEGIHVSIGIPPGEVAIIHTGIVIEIPKGYVGLVWPKSGSNYLIGGGVIDSGYQGEILVKIINPTNRTIEIEHKQAIAQLLIQPVEIPDIVEAHLSEIQKDNSGRGQDGGINRQITYLQGDII